MSEEVTGGSAWLMVVDMQFAFSDKGSSWFMKGYERARLATLDILPFFADRVIYTRFTPPAEEVGGWIPYYERWDEFTRKRAPLPEAAEGSVWDIDLGDDVIRHVLDAPTFSKWIPDRLPHEALESRELFVAGVALECCVLATVLAAIDDSMRVYVVEEAVAASSEAAEEATMTILRGRSPQVSIVQASELRNDRAELRRQPEE